MNRSAPVRAPAGPPRHGQASGGRRWWLVTLGVAAAAVLAAGLVAARAMTAGPAPRHAARIAESPAPSPTRPPRPRPTRRLPVGTMGSYAVEAHVLRLVDRSRRRLGPRALRTVVRYPVIPAATAAAGPLARGLFPLVVFAPGYLQCDGSYAALLDSWASAGYVVAGIEFPHTNCHVTSPDESDLANQPGDMAYVISQLLAVSGARRGVLAGLVNPARIAVAGHSDGGDTVVALAAGSCCMDHQVRASIVLAGAEWPPLGRSYFARATPPMLFVQGDTDIINLPADSIAMYQADHSGPRFYLDLFGSGHLPPYEGRGYPEPVVARVTVAFLDRYLADRPGAGLAMQRAAAVRGVAALVSGGQLPP